MNHEAGACWLPRTLTQPSSSGSWPLGVWGGWAPYSCRGLRPCDCMLSVKGHHVLGCHWLGSSIPECEVTGQGRLECPRPLVPAPPQAHQRLGMPCLLISAYPQSPAESADLLGDIQTCIKKSLGEKTRRTRSKATSGSLSLRQGWQGTSWARQGPRMEQQCPAQTQSSPHSQTPRSHLG